jgi:VWA N-terminal.
LYRRENSSENYTTYTYYGTKAYDPKGEPLDFVQYLNCTQNRHFYNEEVNTSFSSVHVPTNIYHRGEL